MTTSSLDSLVAFAALAPWSSGGILMLVQLLVVAGLTVLGLHWLRSNSRRRLF